jgi:guanylate kinase
LVEENKMMEWASFNNWYYGTPLTALSKDKINIGVFNPEGIRSMLARDDIDLRVFYVSTSPKTRLLRQLNREEHPNVAEIIRRYGTDVEDFKNIDFPCTVVGNENF